MSDFWRNAGDRQRVTGGGRSPWAGSGRQFPAAMAPPALHVFLWNLGRVVGVCLEAGVGAAQVIGRAQTGGLVWGRSDPSLGKICWGKGLLISRRIYMLLSKCAFQTLKNK